MKKIILIFLWLAMAAPALQAQNSNNRRSVEVSGGTNHSRFTDEGAECLLGWFFGAEVVLCENGSLRFSSGAQYRSSGSEYESGEDFGEDGSYSFTTRERLGYLNVPLEARYEFGAGKIKPFVRGGGTFGLLLSAKSKATTNFNGRKNENETDIKNLKKSTNLALSFGGGVSFPLGKYRGLASVRYFLGLTNIVKNKNAPRVRTNDLTYSVGLGIPIF
ncbi:MAG: hypothetical protein ALAOOOJD_01456 [bacterium]|nr:hypothetical protein [bacterium]